PSKVEVINDVNGELVNLYRVVQHHIEEFLRQFEWGLVSRQVFGELQALPLETLTDIQRAARFFYLQKLAFGGKSHDQRFGTATVEPLKLNLQRIKADLSAAHSRLIRTTIECKDWFACL